MFTVHPGTPCPATGFKVGSLSLETPSNSQAHSPERSTSPKQSNYNSLAPKIPSNGQAHSSVRATNFNDSALELCPLGDKPTTCNQKESASPEAPLTKTDSALKLTTNSKDRLFFDELVSAITEKPPEHQLLLELFEHEYFNSGTSQQTLAINSPFLESRESKIYWLTLNLAYKIVGDSLFTPSSQEDLEILERSVTPHPCPKDSLDCNGQRFFHKAVKALKKQDYETARENFMNISLDKYDLDDLNRLLVDNTLLTESSWILDMDGWSQDQIDSFIEKALFMIKQKVKSDVRQEGSVWECIFKELEPFKTFLSDNPQINKSLGSFVEYLEKKNKEQQHKDPQPNSLLEKAIMTMKTLSQFSPKKFEELINRVIISQSQGTDEAKMVHEILSFFGLETKIMVLAESEQDLKNVPKQIETLFEAKKEVMKKVLEEKIDELQNAGNGLTIENIQELLKTSFQDPLFICELLNGFSDNGKLTGNFAALVNLIRANLNGYTIWTDSLKELVKKALVEKGLSELIFEKTPNSNVASASRNSNIETECDQTFKSMFGLGNNAARGYWGNDLSHQGYYKFVFWLTQYFPGIASITTQGGHSTSPPILHAQMNLALKNIETAIEILEPLAKIQSEKMKAFINSFGHKVATVSSQIGKLKDMKASERPGSREKTVSLETQRAIALSKAYTYLAYIPSLMEGFTEIIEEAEKNSRTLDILDKYIEAVKSQLYVHLDEELLKRQIILLLNQSDQFKNPETKENEIDAIATRLADYICRKHESVLKTLNDHGYPVEIAKLTEKTQKHNAVLNPIKESTLEEATEYFKTNAFPILQLLTSFRGAGN